MKPALPALLISPDVKERLKIMVGKKRITIREGHRDYRPGIVMICCPDVPWIVQATIVDVKHTVLSKVTKEEWEADGYENQEQMLSDLTKYYPAITKESDVTVIKWDKITGKLTEPIMVLKYARKNNVYDFLLALLWSQFT